MSQRLSKKRWASFVELKDDLLRDGITELNKQAHKNVPSHPENFLISSISQVVKDAEIAVSAKDFFNCLCRLSALLENLDQDALAKIIRTTNLYVLLLGAVFTNPNFCEKLIFLSKEEKNANGEGTHEKNLDTKKFLNAGISLAFYPSALMVAFFTKENIFFLRHHITKLIKLNLKAANDYEVSFANLCFTAENILRERKYNYTDKFPVTLSADFLFSTLSMTRSVSGGSLLSLNIDAVLGEQFKNATYNIESDDRFDLSGALNNMYGGVFRIEAGIESYFIDVPQEKQALLQSFFDSFNRRNEKNLTFFVKEISSGFQYQKNKTFRDVVLHKVSVAREAKDRLVCFAEQNLAAFTGILVGEEREWSNKVFLVSVKLLTVLVEINNARDNDWKFFVARRELIQWIREVNEILNLYYIEDEFASVAEFLKEENVRTEWKSTFLTPLEQEFINDKAELVKGRDIFLRIVKTILGMINTEGGTIIVGLVENPDRIIREDLLRHVITKNEKSFFNVGHELEQKGKNLDQIRLQVLDNLKSTTQLSEEKFNNLFSFEPILLRNGEKTITIVKISVQRAATPIFNVKEEMGTTWASLTKRADGKTIDVDVRDYIKL